jgi:hypothetical protein
MYTWQQSEKSSCTIIKYHLHPNVLVYNNTENRNELKRNITSAAVIVSVTAGLLLLSTTTVVIFFLIGLGIA